MVSRALAIALLVSAVPSGFGTLPASGKSVQDFVPNGWVVESTHEGALTQDGVDDLVLVLVKREGENQGNRALLALARDGRGLKKLGYNEKFLTCDGCGGISGGNGAPTISIQKGVLIVSQWQGSAVSQQSSVHRFRLDQKSSRLVLIGRDTESRDRTEGTVITVSENFLTGRSVTETSNQSHSSKERSEARIPKRTLPMEDVTIE